MKPGSLVTVRQQRDEAQQWPNQTPPETVMKSHHQYECPWQTDYPIHRHYEVIDFTHEPSTPFDSSLGEEGLAVLQRGTGSMMDDRAGLVPVR